ncbi:hypothetical protein D3C87_1877940 [compost metagenome]
MKGGHHIGQGQQRRVARGWFLLPDIQAGAAQMAAAQGVVQRRLVMDAATRGRQENRVRLHGGERARVDHAARRMVQGAMQGHHVGLRQQVG